jgi:hypothetical protein
MWGVLKIPAVAALLALLALGIAACGGGEDSSSTGSASNQSAGADSAGQEGSGAKAEAAEGGGSQRGTAKGAPAQTQNAADGAGAGGAEGSNGSGQSVSVSNGSKVEVLPLKVSGGGSDEFFVKGGDNSIAEYGEEGSDSELQQAAEAVHNYYAATANDEWPAACAELSDSLVERLGKLFENSPEGEKTRDEGCSAMLDAFLSAPEPDYLSRARTDIDAISLRHEGDEQAFLIYYAFNNDAYAMLMEDDDGEWKVGAMAGSHMIGAGIRGN